MWARIFTILFLALAGAGVWLQQSTMDLYTAEFEAELAADKMQNAVASLSDFKFQKYENGALKSSLKCQQGRIFSDGHLNLTGLVTYESFNSSGGKNFLLQTPKAVGKFQNIREGHSFIDSSRKLENVKFPEIVAIWIGEDRFDTKDVTVNIQEGNLVTSEVVLVRGPGLRLEGRGLQYTMATEEYKIGGKIQGRVEPALRSGKTKH